MLAREFKLEQDKEKLDAFYESRNMPSLPSNLIPQIGYIVDGHAAGFLYVADGGLAFIENFISNEKVYASDRQKALDLVTEALINKARELNVLKLLAFTTAQVIYERCLRYDFRDMGNYRMCVKDLNSFNKDME